MKYPVDNAVGYTRVNIVGSGLESIIEEDEADAIAKVPAIPVVNNSDRPLSGWWILILFQTFRKVFSRTSFALASLVTLQQMFYREMKRIDYKTILLCPGMGWSI
ncbi:hypothetical protein A0256_00820 [Mucilaginibacter sp. PAMC 26640]|nr:hypothetical protein A0256_00820 [Mucilaginibacter sp. PAMC 26640]